MSKDEKLVVEVVAAHNLMPKDGQGSSSPFVEVEFEHQKRRTRAKAKDLNPIWNERLIFSIADPDDLPYRSIDVAVYNDRSAGTAASGRNFLGKARIPTAGVPAPGEEAVPQLFSLEKRSLFSHIRGELSLKIYRTSGTAAGTATGGLNVVKAKNQHAQAELQAKQQANERTTISPAPVPVKPVELDPRPSAEPQPSEVVKPVVLAAAPPQPPMPVALPQESYHMGVAAGRRDFALKETQPRLGGGAAYDKTSSTYDLVEQMQYLYVRVVRARDLPVAGTGGETHAEVKLGNYRGVTRPSGSHHWDQAFAFSKDSIQSSTVEMFLIREREARADDVIGRLSFDLSEVPHRVPPDSSLAPQWYRLENKNGEKCRGEVMVSVWYGTQADESFSEAWHSRAAGVHADVLASIKSKVYVAPKLWYLRVSVIEAQDLVSGDKSGTSLGLFPELFAKVQVGNQTLRTRSAPVGRNPSFSSPVWNEDLLFVVAEPFDEPLLLSIEDRQGPCREESLGRVAVPVPTVERRLDDKPVASRWFGLNRPGGSGRFMSRVHLRLSLDGGYHVLDETTMYSSDLRPPAKQLWSPHVGLLELGILGATGLMPMKLRDGKAGGGGGGTTDAYCVAKYGQKWIRTRTAVDSFSPKWNEQYTWEVFDPCTVITIGVFDNSLLAVGGFAGGGDARIGKVRIRLSTLQTDRIYCHSYPLLVLHPTGVKKMGELQLAIRISCANVGNTLHSYVRPLLPKMHYVEPLLVRQVENLRYQATRVVAARLGRAEPPLGREVVEYLLDHGSSLWCMRKSKANFFRLVAVISGPIAVGRWLESIRSWQRPVNSFLVSVVFIVFVFLPELILPAGFAGTALVGLWRYRSRPRDPPHMDTRLSQADAVYADELDEEFDGFPTSRGPEVVRMRYDRLRSVAGRVQTVVGDVGTQGERVQALLSWRDPRATLLFLSFCLAAAVVSYTLPFRVVAGAWGLYLLRPPRFRSRLPSLFMSFFRRLPTKADSLL
ncbi:C2 and GRAM domain-containing protein [Apostasia shenzhenica]|uniref:C2 and GRAM domain-containing protein n=1 Tax=Apostasia shenzhenica TaxID=1088818 RepID=A0A2I0AYJ9_9ASPA|nr:C2 and GRAM domain-containing protein [Apostasia shenzhenica]